MGAFSLTYAVLCRACAVPRCMTWLTYAVMAMTCTACSSCPFTKLCWGHAYLSRLCAATNTYWCRQVIPLEDQAAVDWQQRCVTVTAVARLGCGYTPVQFARPLLHCISPFQISTQPQHGAASCRVFQLVSCCTQCVVGVFSMMTVVLSCWLTWLPLLLAGTQHGQLLCVKGAGVPRPGLNGVEYGHHYFEVIVQVPSATEATRVELQLLQQLAMAVQQQHGRLHHGRPTQQPQQQHGADDVQHMQDHARRLVTNTVRGGQLDGQQGSQDHHQQQQQQQQTQDAAAGTGQHFLDPP